MKWNGPRGGNAGGPFCLINPSGLSGKRNPRANKEDTEVPEQFLTQPTRRRKRNGR